MASTSLRPNLVKRVQRLPKPTNVATALQPLFEAISNAIHSTQAKFGSKTPSRGRVVVTISTNRKKENVWATVEDNGVGLDADNWDAFTTTDTDNKIQIGGKGVGRLLWLDCFQHIHVESVFLNGTTPKKRIFDFELSLQNQITNERVTNAPPKSDTSFFVKFEGLRDNGYLDKFPGRESFVFQHLTSHFLPTFIGGRCPKVTVHVGDETRNYPQDINKIVERKSDEIAIRTDEFGTLKLTLMECNKIASADLKGTHFVHFIAHDRTVKSQSIDGKLGFRFFGENDDRVFHAILTGKFLDENVNQERTAFSFEDSVIESIINDVCSQHIEEFLSRPIAELKYAQKEKISQITETYPSVAFGDAEELQAKLPTGELNDDAIYGHLARERFRRDQRQAEKIRDVFTRLKETGVSIGSFSDAIKEAGQAIGDAERRSLAEYVVRRKVVLDFLGILLEKVRDDVRDSSFQREDILHSFICPLRVSTIADGSRKIETATSHDLWILDERLNLTIGLTLGRERPMVEVVFIDQTVVF
jgi:hypothetical protein